MNYIVDLIVLGIIIITAYISSKRGFAKTLIELIGFILALSVASFAGTFVAETVYTNNIEKPIVESVGEAVEKNGEKIFDANKVWDSLPNLAKTTLKTFNITEETLQNKYNENISLKENAKIDAQETAKKLSNDIIKPVIVKILSIFISVIIFLILSIIVRFIANSTTKLINLTFARGLNKKLGFIVGIPKGILYSLIFCAVLAVLISISKDSFWIFSKEALQNSFTVKGINSILPSKYLIF